MSHRVKVAMITVIVAALALLIAAIVFPPFAYGGPKNPPKALCMSNLKQLDLATIMYSTDSDDKAPPCGIWMDALGPYAKNGQIFHCPEVANPDAYGYAFNAGVGSFDDKYPYASTTPLIYDSLSLGRNAFDAVGSLPVPGRHEGYDNVAYLDGHVRTVQFPAK